GSAGMNLYPAGQQFSGDYALRFDMYLSFGTSSTTEHALAGLNHSGLMTNRFTQSTDTNHTVTGGDGVWVSIVSDASNLIDYGAYATTNPATGPFVITNVPASRFTSVFPSPPYAFAGSPTSTGTNQSWADVELSQIAGIISLKINQNLIFQVTNSFSPRSGNIMLGMNDQFDSVGSVSNFVIFDNVRVVSMETRITSITFPNNEKVQIDFFSPLSTNPDTFRLQSASSLSPTVWSDAFAEISGREGGLRAIATRSGDTRFYRIVH
ncbi:MAG TPA: hypothetical protein VMZ27_04475, partial [Candidatus Saccharimonadales bacterium]|nr:hypothetical protein [Candidatus Saccharimonadales bacterium]